MAFSNGLGERTDELRFRNPQSPSEDSAFNYNSPLSPSRGAFPSKIHTHTQNQTSSSNDARASLHRRFTTNALPTLSPIGQQRRLAAEPQDHTNTVCLVESTQPANRQHHNRPDKPVGLIVLVYSILLEVRHDS